MQVHRCIREQCHAQSDVHRHGVDNPATSVSGGHMRNCSRPSAPVLQAQSTNDSLMRCRTSSHPFQTKTSRINGIALPSQTLGRLWRAVGCRGDKFARICAELLRMDTSCASAGRMVGRATCGQEKDECASSRNQHCRFDANNWYSGPADYDCAHSKARELHCKKDLRAGRNGGAK